MHTITGPVGTTLGLHYRRNIHDPPRIDLIRAPLNFRPYVPAIFLILIGIRIFASDIAERS